jgi:argininosuccinate lyase
MDIRGPRLRKPSERALEFTSSLAFDGRIARQVVRVNMAHMAALVRAGEVDRAVGAKCMKFLLGASTRTRPGARAEDFHQLLEQAAVDTLGVKTAGYLNYGKSRNDQVATAVRMELRDAILLLLEALSDLQGSMLRLVKKDGRIVLPGYTHLQRAQPVTLAHHFFAHFDALQRDADRFSSLYSRVNLSPMGSAAMAGTSARVDRSYVAKSLGFDGLVRNAMDAVSSRDFAFEALSCATMVMLDVSRLAEELILWSSSEFGLLELDDAYTASSSIMPQKKNAVVAEVARAKAGSVLGHLVAVGAILKALPYSYNLDLQETTPHLWSALDDTAASLRVIAGALGTSRFDATKARESVSEDGSTAVALANYLVKEQGVSFREAHSLVGELVRTSAEKRIPLRKVVATRLGSVSKGHGKTLRVDEKTAKLILDPVRFLEGIATQGGSNPRFTAAGLSLRTGELSRNRASASRLSSAVRKSEKALQTTASGLAREVKTSS